MRCAKFLVLLDDLIDGTLASVNREYLVAHLDDCLPCASVRRDFDLIVKLARELRDQLTAPPPNIKSAVLNILNTPTTTSASNINTRQA
ncbi:MAG TPA: hypothetical protein VF666_11535 [Pyrinomonadaceae bacterium]|jgi:hypothetical protein